ncbi:MAG: hypothetical protein LAP85_13250 [Acidobacteriia bacterium]|nr:hypothetical protein [Terriglobia bacterium]
MRIKAPRWLLILEALLLSGALLVLAYKAATRVLPLPLYGIEQKRGFQKPAARPTILDYYRQYPDRYIRVDNESWQCDKDSRIALHSFTLRNLATVAYKEIEVRFTYESASGKTLLTRDVKIPSMLQAQGTLSLKKIKVTGVPADTKTAVTSVSKAVIVQ